MTTGVWSCSTASIIAWDYIPMGSQRQFKETWSILEADEKASELMFGLLNALGFKQVLTSQHHIVWRLARGNDIIEIAPGSNVTINGIYKCIVVRAPLLPPADVIFAKLIAIATNLRNSIPTLLKEDRKVLDRLLPLDITGEKINKFLEGNQYVQVLEKTREVLPGRGTTESECGDTGDSGPIPGQGRDDGY